MSESDGAAEETVTILAVDAARAAQLLQQVANADDGRWTWDLLDVADLLTPGSWGAPGTPYVTVQRRQP